VTASTDGQPDAGGRPLDGMLVVALEQAVAAPFATRQLADLGARVIKIERPGRGDFARDYDSAAGDGMSSWFVWLNRSKESVVLDLKAGGGRRALDLLIGRADVFVCNLAPAAIRRLGLGAGQLTARHPRLVACQLSGYGEVGPYADRKAYDLLVQAEAGVLAVTGSPDAPAKAGISIADIAGGMYAYSGILSALLQRERTGRGDVVEVSLFAALAEWMSHPLQLTRLTGQAPPRNGARHATIVPYGDYVTADGDAVLLGVQNEAEWVRLCDVLGLPAMAGDGRFAGNQSRVEHRGEVEAQLGRAIARLAASDLLQRLERAQIAYASVKGIGQVVSHPQLAPRWTAIMAGDRRVDVLPPPVQHGSFGPVLGPVPRHGRDTGAVLAEIAGDGAAGTLAAGALAAVDPFPVAVLAALLDDGLATPGRGEQLPPYWHLAACATAPRSGTLGADGHPGDGLVPAPGHLPRRMFAGGRLRAAGPVHVGERLTRRTLITASADKEGRSGPLRFVTVENRLSRPDGAVVLVEEQDIVFRAAAGPGPATSAPTDSAPAESTAAGGATPVAAAPGPLLTPRGAPLHALFRADPVALQRFSAATSNPHRIHYDHPYVTAVEGYPGLVVHGPLLLISLLELIRLDLPGRAVQTVTFQARSPVFAGEAVDLAGELSGADQVSLAARHTDGSAAMTCEVTLRPGQH
jgi:crotonobetainyl-CoA:carnitine CoA-transferase CaiB-like acyl-CoA transferase/hydroxyacyl-ACP dehydratase HTD2-like protein with hotdog domain